MDYRPVQVCTWGDFACFTRPEMKVERVTYEVPTPSAARGLLEAIFWKPEIQWQIREIRVMKPIRHFSLVRNELKGRASIRSIQQRTREQGGYYIEDDRTQRHTLCLRDVAYTIIADLVVKPGVQEDAAKYRDQFQRRVRRGQCYHMPYFGCREFSAFFGPEFPDTEQFRQQDISLELGRMLFDLAYLPDGRGRPTFFMARLFNGVLSIPATLYG